MSNGQDNDWITLDQGGNQPFATVSLQLERPTARLRVRDPRRLGRAEARFAGERWAAKHHFTEGSGADRVTVYEFDEALPSGAVEIVIPVE